MPEGPIERCRARARSVRHNTGAMPLSHYRGPPRRAARKRRPARHGPQGRRAHRRDSRQGHGRQSAVDAAVAVDRAVRHTTTARHPEYGGGVDASLLVGHHGSQPVPRHLRRAVRCRGRGRAAGARRGVARAVRARAVGPGRSSSGRCCRSTNLRVERTNPASRTGSMRVKESVENPSGVDRPIGWTQHVTLGPPFLEKGVTEFRASATRSKVFERAVRKRRLPRACSRVRLAGRAAPGGGTADLRRSSPAAASSAYTAHLMDPQLDTALFRRVFARRQARIRLRLAPGRLSVDGHLGGKRQPAAAAVERRDAQPAGWSSASLPFPRPAVR